MINDLLFILADVEIFGSDFFDKKDFIELLVRSAFNFLIVGYIVRYLYYPVTKKQRLPFYLSTNQCNGFLPLFFIRKR